MVSLIEEGNDSMKKAAPKEKRFYVAVCQFVARVSAQLYNIMLCEVNS